jgi:hypothetical protein
MNTGRLYFDNSKIPLAKKIAARIADFEKRYGRKPNLCLVHPSLMEWQQFPEGITVRPYRPVLPGHVWIGIEDEA